MSSGSSATSGSTAGTVHVIVPDGIDDPRRASGGNAYDRRVCRALAASGWSVHEHAVAGSWPRPDAAARAALTRVIESVADGVPVLVDGLIASVVPEVLVPAARRLRLIVLVHMPLGDMESGDGDAGIREHAVLSAASAIVTTSGWTRQRLVRRYALPSDRVHVAEPGVDEADLAPGSKTGSELLCVAAVAPHKGHDALLAALATVTNVEWQCVLVGPLDRDPGFVGRLRRQAEADGIDDRVRFSGPRTGDDLDAAYAAADVLVLASHAETYGMVVTEALARGLPVIATAVGGVPEALGWSPDGSRPGLLVPPGDPTALAAALQSWLDDADARHRLRRAAQQRRATLTGWACTAARVSRVLSEVAA